MLSPKRVTPGEPDFPTAAELVTLYSELAECARYKEHQDFIDAVTAKRVENIVIIVRSTESQRLMGYLHAWRGDKVNPGIIYEIAVAPGHRGLKYAKRMRDFLLKENPGEWRGHSFRISSNLERHLNVVRMMYVVALAFGFQKTVDSTYGQVFRRFLPPVGEHPIQLLPPNAMPAVIFLFFALGLLGIRFFWATGNIRRFLLHRVFRLKAANAKILLLLHFPLLILHAVLFFFLCRFYQDICTNMLHDTYVLGLLTVFTLLLALNVFWLALLRTKPDDSGPEWHWMANNIAFAALSIVAYQVFHHCHVEVNTQLYLTDGLLLSNSILDFFLTGGTYFLGDAFGGG